MLEMPLVTMLKKQKNGEEVGTSWGLRQISSEISKIIKYDKKVEKWWKRPKMRKYQIIVKKLKTGKGVEKTSKYMRMLLKEKNVK